jgi:hypothetical protein
MRRLLRTLASLDVVKDLGEGRFELTPVGHCLRADVPGSVRPMPAVSPLPALPAREKRGEEAARPPRMHPRPMIRHTEILNPYS